MKKTAVLANEELQDYLVEKFIEHGFSYIDKDGNKRDPREFHPTRFPYRFTSDFDTKTFWIEE